MTEHNGKNKHRTDIMRLITVIVGIVLFLSYCGRVSSDTSAAFSERSPSAFSEPSSNSALPWDVFHMKSPPPQPVLAIDNDIKKEIYAKRGIYGGKDDPVHVGGFLQNDTSSYEPWIWDWLINEMKIESMVDVGCGRGISTQYFSQRGVKAHCFEGSSDGVKNSLVPQLVTEHDFTRGPIWTDDIVDVAWSIEFLEHVGTEHMANYMAAFKKARIVFVSHSIWGGWHHVTVKKRYWWIEAFRDYGFEYMPEMSEQMQDQAGHKQRFFPKGKRHSYFHNNGLVFRNMDIPWKHKLHPWVKEEVIKKEYSKYKGTRNV